MSNSGSRGSQTTGAAYSRDDARRDRMRRSSKGLPAAKDNHLENMHDTFRRRAMIALIGGAAVLSAWVGSFFIKTAEKLDLSKYKPLEGLIVSYKSQPMLVEIGDNGQLQFAVLKNYASHVEGYDSLIFYTQKIPVATETVLPVISSKLPQLENSIMGRVLRPTPNSDQERKQIAAYAKLRDAIHTYDREMKFAIMNKPAADLIIPVKPAQKENEK